MNCLCRCRAPNWNAGKRKVNGLKVLKFAINHKVLAVLGIGDIRVLMGVL